MGSLYLIILVVAFPALWFPALIVFILGNVMHYQANKSLENPPARRPEYVSGSFTATIILGELAVIALILFIVAQRT